MVRSAAIRGSGSRSTSASSIMATRPVVPATYVPEELVTQAQVVLQGKTRNLIIRELQVIIIILGFWEDLLLFLFNDRLKINKISFLILVFREPI